MPVAGRCEQLLDVVVCDPPRTNLEGLDAVLEKLSARGVAFPAQEMVEVARVVPSVRGYRIRCSAALLDAFAQRLA
jgi:hypothetical protein